MKLKSPILLLLICLLLVLGMAGCAQRRPPYERNIAPVSSAVPEPGEAGSWGVAGVEGRATRWKRSAEGPGEFRAMWVSRFEWPSADKAECQRRIERIMADLADHGFNAVMFQVRGQMDVLYPSPYEPWSEQLGRAGVDPGWDPLRYAIERAHAHGLEFHAYINTHTAWQSASGRPPAHSTPEHPFYLHCNANGNHDWLICGPSGTPVQWESDGYVWCAPGVPEFNWWTRRVVMHIVCNYDVDGIQFDRIRTPERFFSHDPISMARMAGAGNPGKLGFEDWTRDQITRMLNDIYAEVTAVKPWVKVTASPIGIYDRSRFPGYGGFNDGYNLSLQDSQRWLQMGVVDALLPQIYWSVGGNPSFDLLLRDWQGHSYGRHIYPGQVIRKYGFPEIEKQISLTRSSGGSGNCLFSYGSASPSILEQYAAGPYARKQGTPEMPWKTNPQTGTIMGVVRAPGGSGSVTDAWIRRDGNEYTWLSGYDGFYAMLNVPPGTYTIRAAKYGLGGVKYTGVTVEAGKVTRADLPMYASR